jgi:hypothetical protein
MALRAASFEKKGKLLKNNLITAGMLKELW